MDTLSPLLERFTVNAHVFFAGTLCTTTGFERQPARGAIHLLRQGVLHVDQENGELLTISEPTALFYPQPYQHRFRVDPVAGADLVCAWIDFGASRGNPLLRGLPPLIHAPLAQIPGIESSLATLFAEAFADRVGRQAALNRLTEFILVLLLRHGMEQQTVVSSVLAGLADARLRKAIVAMHEFPERPWTLDLLASVAGMSRPRFAAHFRAITGETPLDYLTDWRITTAQSLLRRGVSTAMAASQVGYTNSAAFARVFTKRIGVSPSKWLAQG